MPRSAASRAVEAAVLLLGAALPAVVLATVRALPPADLPAAGLGWLTPALAGSLVLSASAAAVTWLVVGLRGGATAALLGAVAAGVMAGGALLVVLAGTMAGLLVAVPLSAILLGAATAADRLEMSLATRRSRVVVAATGLLAAELVVVAAALPAVAEAIEAWRAPLLLAAVVAAVAAGLPAGGRWVAIACAAVAVGAAGLLLDRGGGLEAVIGLLALVAATIAGLRASRRGGAVEPGLEPASALPPLAHHLGDAVLDFDGGLGLRDWNAAAAALLGLDADARGTRLEDLLGIRIADLPPVDGASVVGGAVGGLEIRLHRSGSGVVVIVADGRERADDDRLGRELRGTIEELLQARRTIELQRAEIERSATVDPLTGVASRSAILDRLRTEIAEARRYQHPVALVLLDVDDFAALNHRHGVRGGDALLREVALRMRLRVREADALGRAGSDGFLAILPHTDEAGAATFAAALRHRLAQRPVPVGEERVPITVSVGVAVMRPGDDLDLDRLLARVGEALDSARLAGGDRIALDREHGFVRLGRDDERVADDRDEEAN